jgi:hypothetical protein
MLLPGYSAQQYNSGALITPIHDFAKAFGPGLLKQTNPMTTVLEFVNVRPNLRLPAFIVYRHLATRSTASVEAPSCPMHRSDGLGKLDENAANLLDILISVDDVLVAKQESEA